jgi:hypothetical protein
MEYTLFLENCIFRLLYMYIYRSLYFMRIYIDQYILLQYSVYDIRKHEIQKIFNKEVN